MKRTQLRRSVYHILGEKVVKGDEDTSSQRDAHLHNYNVDVFDDDDFYHQVGEVADGTGGLGEGSIFCLGTGSMVGVNCEFSNKN